MRGQSGEIYDLLTSLKRIINITYQKKVCMMHGFSLYYFIDVDINNDSFKGGSQLNQIII